MAETKLTPAQRAFLMRDAYDETWIGCPLAHQRVVAKNLAAKGLGTVRGTGRMARFHFNDVGRETRHQLILTKAANLLGEYE